MSELWHRNLPVPFFSQRENIYCWQRIAGDDGSGGEDISSNDTQGIGGGHYNAGDFVGNPVSLAWGSCNITSLCMILHYYGITDDTPDIMMQKFFDADQYKYRKEEYASDKGPNRLGFNSELRPFVTREYRIPEENIQIKPALKPDQVQEQIAKGNPVWFSYGATTGATSGHIAVIRGFTEHNDLIINDPWGDASTPFGYLSVGGSSNAAPYYAASPDDYSKYYGMGSGDNCILRQGEFKKITEPLNLHQTMAIQYPHVWSFPLKQNMPDKYAPGVYVKSIFRFSQPADSDKLESFRVSQIQNMFSHITQENAGYPLGTHTRCWHDGIHITGARYEGVYAIGPGRLIAARMACSADSGQDGSNAFALIRHNVILNNTEKEFFSLYMHLAPIDIRSRIRANLVSSTRQAGSAVNEPDWLNQVLQYMHPKVAIIRVKAGTEADPADGLEPKKDLKIFREVSRNVFEFTGGYLQDRGLIHLYPQDNDVRRLFEDIDLSINSRNMSDWLTLINNNTLYKKSCNIIRAVYANLGKELENYADVLFSQNQDFKYRDKGKVTYLEAIKTVLASNFKTSLAGNNRSELYNNLKTIYENKIIQQEGLPQRNAIKYEFWGFLAQSLADLLSYPAEYLNYEKPEKFTKKEPWYKDLLTMANSLNRLSYRRLYEEEIQWKALKNQIETHMPVNIDYHIEVSGNTKLGSIGIYKEKNIIHFEIFSDNSLIGGDDISDSWGTSNNKKFVIISVLDKNRYFDKTFIIKEMRRKNFYMDTKVYNAYWGSGFLTANDLKQYYDSNKAFNPEQFIITQHLNSYVDLPLEELNKLIDSGVGVVRLWEDKKLLREELLHFKWLDKAVYDAIDPKPSDNLKNFNATFYHPIRFLEWLDKIQVPKN